MLEGTEEGMVTYLSIPSDLLSFYLIGFNLIYSYNHSSSCLYGTLLIYRGYRNVHAVAVYSPRLLPAPQQVSKATRVTEDFCFVLIPGVL